MERNLQLPHAISPLQSLERSVKQLNDSNHLSDDLRWEEYKRIFMSYFAHVKPNLNINLTASENIEVDDGKKNYSSLFSDVGEKTVVKIIESLPKTLKSRAKQIINHLAASSEIKRGDYQITEKGELKVYGELIPDSNFLDLIHFALRRRKRRLTTPPGWSEFLILLKKSNVPVEFLTSKIPSKEQIKRTSRLSVKSSLPQMASKSSNEGFEVPKKTEYSKSNKKKGSSLLFSPACNRENKTIH